jgi:TrmH family RNA methyltransferase
MTEPITSRSNERLKELRKLHERKHRDRSRLFVAEGEDMLTEALRFGAVPRSVFYDADRLDVEQPPLSSLAAQVDLVPVAAEALESASSLGSGSRVIGVWAQRWSRLEADRGQAGDRVPGAYDGALYLHEVSDPGNVGAVLRSALALVRAIVVLSPGSADPFGPKAVRASMGAIFGQPVTRASFEQARAALGPGWRAIALSARAGTPLRDVDLEGEVLFCLGAERLGLPDEIVASCDETARVPLRADGAESLNVAMAATLCLYESAVHRLSS